MIRLLKHIFSFHKSPITNVHHSDLINCYIIRVERFKCFVIINPRTGQPSQFVIWTLCVESTCRKAFLSQIQTNEARGDSLINFRWHRHGRMCHFYLWAKSSHTHRRRHFCLIAHWVVFIQPSFHLQFSSSSLPSQGCLIDSHRLGNYVSLDCPDV